MNWTGVLIVWGLVGIILTPMLPRPGTRLQATLLLIISGPAGWYFFIKMTIQLYLYDRTY